MHQKKNMTNYQSNKIRFLSFALIILIIIHHSQTIPLSTGLVKFVQIMISQEIIRIATPMFFIASGYLFFRNFKNFNANHNNTGDKSNQHLITTFFLIKIKRRFHSIFIPYFLTAVIGLILLSILQAIPSTRIFFTKQIVSNFNSGDYLHYLFVEPLATYQLWFLRDLFLIILISPIVYLLAEKMRYTIFLFLLLDILNVKFYFIRTESLTFFLLGSIIALHYSNKTEYIYKNRILNIILPIFWIAICTLLYYIKPQLPILTYSTLHTANIILGIYAIWRLYDSLYPHLSHRIDSTNLYHYTFFLFLMHEPMLNHIKQSLLYLGKCTPLCVTFTYTFAPLLTIILCICIGKLFNKHFPSFYRLITGGR